MYSDITTTINKLENVNGVLRKHVCLLKHCYDSSQVVLVDRKMVSDIGTKMFSIQSIYLM